MIQALAIASEDGHVEIVDVLLKGGANADELSDQSQTARTPLSLAAENGHVAIVKRLIESGATVDTRDRRGRTVLIQDSHSGCPPHCIVHSSPLTPVHCVWCRC